MKAEQIGTLEAKTNLSSLLNEVRKGRIFHITKHGKPIAELRPVSKGNRKRKAGFGKGTFARVARDFDAPLKDFNEYME